MRMKINTILFIGLCILFIGMSIPFIYEKIGPNPVYGFRISKTMKDDVIWYKANKFLGYAMVIASIFSLLCLTLKLVYPAMFLLFEQTYYDITVFTVPLLISIVTSFIYVLKL